MEVSKVFGTGEFGIGLKNHSDVFPLYYLLFWVLISSFLVNFRDEIVNIQRVNR